MPELPEVETIRRGLSALVEGARIISVTMRRPDLRFPFPADLCTLAGARIETIERRAKYLLFGLDDGRLLLSHLGMTGAWRIDDDPFAEPTRLRGNNRSVNHDHLILGIRREGRDAGLVYNDPRRFGFVTLEKSLETAKALRGLGPEPLGNAFSPDYLAKACAGRAAPIKSILLDQRIIAGLGNIYVSEALWRAGIAPDCPAGRLTETRLALLVAAIRAVLTDAIAAGGSTLKDYVDANGGTGYFQHSFDVYGRDGDACHRPGCTGTILRMTQSGRSSFYCPVCQSK